MKDIVLVILLLSWTGLSFGQDDFQKVFFDAEWKMVPRNEAVYYRMSHFDAVGLTYADTVTDYYLSNGQIEMQGFYKEGKKHGVFTFFFPNGSVRMIAEYINGERSGRWIEYFQDGKVRTELKYVNGRELIVALNDKDGRTIIEKTKFSVLIPYRESSTALLKRIKELQIDGRVVDQKRHGEWTVWDKDQVYATLSYKDGEMVNGYRYRRDKKTKIYGKDDFTLLPEPDKISITEKIVKKDGAILPNNYVLESVYQNTYLTMTPFEVNSMEQLESYIERNFELRSTAKPGVLHVELILNEGRITDCICDSDVSKNIVDDLKLILKPVRKLTFTSDNRIVIDLKVDKENQIVK